jgi:hypothetical protein
MSAPTPPQLDPVISFTHKLRDRADIVIAGHRVAILLILACVLFGGYEGWTWHIAETARLEAQAKIEKTRATNEHALGEAWKARAIARTDTMQAHVVTVHKIIRSVRVDTVMVPAMPDAGQDGVTYSEAPPLVPMEVVSKLAFDSLGAACERVELDCTSALAAKDSVIAHQDSAQAALAALNQNTAKQLTMQKHATIWAKLIWGVGGLLIGRVLH